jgi:hypothetical protein
VRARRLEVALEALPVVARRRGGDMHLKRLCEAGFGGTGLAEELNEHFAHRLSFGRDGNGAVLRLCPEEKRV